MPKAIAAAAAKVVARVEAVRPRRARVAAGSPTKPQAISAAVPCRRPVEAAETRIAATLTGAVAAMPSVGMPIARPVAATIGMLAPLAKAMAHAKREPLARRGRAAAARIAAVRTVQTTATTGGRRPGIADEVTAVSPWIVEAILTWSESLISLRLRAAG
jgi:hypothetical protein